MLKRKRIVAAALALAFALLPAGDALMAAGPRLI